MWQPKQPASEVVATFSFFFTGQSMSGLLRLPMPAISAPCRVRSPIGTAKPRRFQDHADRADLQRLVVEADVGPPAGRRAN